MVFDPDVGLEITIKGAVYKVSANPHSSWIPYGQEGRQAIVYQVIESKANIKKALKVFKPRFRSPELVSISEKLAPWARLPGLKVCERIVLTPRKHASLLRQHPDLIYAVLMPWIDGPTWTEIVDERRELSAEQSHLLATELATVLSNMEQNRLAHCDLSGSNVILPALLTQGSQDGVELVDVEQFYSPNMDRPSIIPAGSSGYAHVMAQSGIWQLNADRFAGAVMLSEILGWCDARLRQVAWGETYFESTELQRSGERYSLLLKVLNERWSTQIGNLFQRAWHSQTLADCPTFGEWLLALVTPLQEALHEISAPPNDTQKVAQVPPKQNDIPEGNAWLDQQRSQAYAFASQRQWTQVIDVCDKILGEFGEREQNEIVLLRSRAMRILDAEETVDKTWNRAVQSGHTSDWEACWKAARIVLQQSPDARRFSEISAQAEQEMLWAAAVERAQVLIDKQQWEDAASLLNTVPADHIFAAGIRAQLEAEQNRQRRLTEIKQQIEKHLEARAWDNAIVAAQMGLALRGDPETFETLSLQAQQEKVTERQVANYIQDAERAEKQADWDKSIDLLQQSLTLRPQRTDLKVKIQSLQERKEWTLQIDAACDTYDLKRVEALLKASPSDYSVDSWNKWLRQERDRRAELTAAQETYDLEKMTTLLDTLPDDYPEREALQRWLQDEQIRAAQLEAARQEYNGERILSLLQDVSSEYPGLETWRHWAQSELTRCHKLNTAHKNYEGEPILAQLMNVSSDYPRLEEWQARAEQHIQLREQLKRVREHYAHQELLDMLSDLPDDYPDKAALQDWAEREARQQAEIEAAGRAYDIERVESLLDALPSAHPILTPWREWGTQERERQAALATAQKTYDLENMAALLDTLPDDYPEREVLQQWLQDEQTRAVQLDAARQEYNGERVLNLLQDVSSEYPALEAWRHWAQQEINRCRELKAARESYNGAQILVLLEEVSSDYPRISELRVWAERYVQVRQELGAAHKHYAYQELLNILSDLPDDYPDKAALQDWAEREARQQAEIEAAGRAYDIERVESLLDALPSAHPILTPWREWVTQERERQAALATVQKTYDLENMAALLDTLPDDYPEREVLQQWLQDEQIRAVQLDAARQEYNGERVLNLLQDVSSEYPDLEAWQHWAQQEINRCRELKAARESYDGAQILVLLEEVSSDYPDLEVWRHWARTEIARGERLDAAIRSYDAAKVLALLADVPSNYPQLEEHRAWATTQQGLCNQLREAQRAYDLDTVMALAEQLPVEHPEAEPLQRWLKTEQQRREMLSTARDEENWEELLALLETLPSDYPNLESMRAEAQAGLERRQKLEQLYTAVEAAYERREWEQVITLCETALVLRHEPRFETRREQARREMEIDQQVQQASQAAEVACNAGDWETALAHLARALAMRPEREDLQTQYRTIETEWKRYRLLCEAQQALENGNWTDVLNLLSGMSNDDVEIAALRDAARTGQADELKSRAEAAEESGAWAEAISAVETLVPLQGSKEGLEQWLEHLRHEQEVATAVMGIQEALEKRQWAKALNVAETAYERFPVRDEFPPLLQEAQAAWDAWQARRQRRRKIAALILMGILLLSCGMVLWGAIDGGGPAGPLFWTATPTATLTPTPTPTATSTPTPTPTSTATPTPTSTNTPTLTPTPTPTFTPTPTHTPTSTPIPPTPTFTPIPPTPTPEPPTPTPPPPPTPIPPTPTPTPVPPSPTPTLPPP